MAESTLVPVAVACRCPGTPHDGDSVYLYPNIGLHGGIVAQNIIVSDLDRAELQAALLDCYVRYGVADWTFTGEDGEKVTDAIESVILRDFSIGAAVADKADDLYTPTVLDPLKVGRSRSSRPSQTNGSTSAQTASSSKPRKRPKSSSTTTSPTDATAATSS